MKKIFPIAALALAGCSIYPGAAEWNEAGYSAEGFRNCRQLGLLKPNVLPVLKRFFSYENDLNYCPTEVIKISSGIDAGKFTLDDLKTFVDYLDQNVFDLRDKEFLEKYFLIDYSHNLLSAIKDVHRGIGAQTILLKAFDERRRKDAALRRAEEEKRLEEKRKEEQRIAEEKKFQNRIKNAIGSEGVSLCGGVDTKRWPEFGYYSNPYAPVGKCYLTTIRYFMNGVQWLSREKLLVIQPLPPGLGYQQPILYKGSEPIRVGVEAIVYGEEPETYESALGAVVNPTTYRVLGYLPLPIEEFNRH